MKNRKDFEDHENKERLEYFKAEGIKASDKYYINQDNRNEMLSNIKK